MNPDTFPYRHIGPRSNEIESMAKALGVESLDDLINKTIPESIRLKEKMDLPEGMTEHDYLKHIWKIATKNKVFKSYIGQGYYDTMLPTVILRNVFENPSWYTSYTPYQAEISQGRLEALLNFQTMVIELTGMEVANASLLDESTAAAEAMIMCFNSRSRKMAKSGANKFFIDENIFPQTLNVVKTRAVPLNIEIVTGNYREVSPDDNYFGILLQYPAADGGLPDYEPFIKSLTDTETQVCVAADLMSLMLLTPPGEWGADVVVGSTQRFGIPMGYGGPHAAYFATRDKYKRNIPGRIIGVSVDAQGNPALRMALQTREQHIKRERATSNICTAQALLASMASLYAVYHGPAGLHKIAADIHAKAGVLAKRISEFDYKIINQSFFDTLKIELPKRISAHDIKILALEREMNFFYPTEDTVQISIDQTTRLKDINQVLEVFAIASGNKFKRVEKVPSKTWFADKHNRKSEFLKQDVFNSYHSETEMMRYIKRLERKDFSLTHSMISLGSCTMKLNAATELIPLSWPEFNSIHPFAPIEQTEGYQQLFHELGKYLIEITGFAGITFQPNSGAAGEYAGLLMIREYHLSRGEGHRNIVLIPSSAHGTNPASGVMAGMKVVVVDCDEYGNIDVTDLEKKAEENSKNLAAFMITYPSTHGVFEPDVKKLIKTIHKHGGQVYMDGANMNAQVGLTNPGIIGADVCHLNLHKTFAIPHGGGGPGVGPVCVAEHLVEFLPTHPVVATGGKNGIGSVAGAPWGSSSILVISYAYCRLLGEQGLTESTRVAILNANYLANALKDHYKILYKGKAGFVAHEMILDCRPFKNDAGITEADIAKRLMDYGFHAPTLSFPVHGTLMVEPTESESLQELDRFVEAMESIHNEIEEIKSGAVDKDDNVLKNAPHTAEATTSDDWSHPYKRKKAAYPMPWNMEIKLWPAVGRINDAYGDRNLVCTCAPIDSYRKEVNPTKLEV